MSAQEERAWVGRAEDARNSNERIAQRAAQLRFVSRVPMLCECSNPRCTQIFLIGLDRYRELQPAGYITTPGHTVDGHKPALRQDDYWLQRRHG